MAARDPQWEEYVPSKSYVEVRADDTVVDNWDYCFAENGLTAWKLGNELESASFIKYVGEEEYKKMVNFILRYLSEVDVPVKRYVADSPDYVQCWFR